MARATPQCAGQRMVFSMNGAGSTGLPRWKKTHLDPYLPLYTKNNATKIANLTKRINNKAFGRKHEKKSMSK